MSKLVQFEIACDLETFIVYFMEPSWYHQFLATKLEDLHVSVGDWTSTAGSSNLSRNIRSFHPSKISFPGLPSHAESFKAQSLSVQGHQQGDQTAVVLTISEINSFRDIPYADYFNVHLDWTVTCKKHTNTMDIPSSGSGTRQAKASAATGSVSGAGGRGDDGTHSLLHGRVADTDTDIDKINDRYICIIEVFLEFKFFQSTWLQSTIESNTRSELMSVFEMWRLHAIESLPWAQEQQARGAPAIFLRDGVRVPFQLLEDISSSNPSTNAKTSPAAAAVARDLSGVVHASLSLPDVEAGLEAQMPPRERGRRRASLRDLNALHTSDTDDDAGSVSSSDADMFFDAQEGPSSGSKKRNGGAGRDADPFYRMNMSGDFQTPRDVAIRVVETAFVLSAFMWWSAHDWYLNTIDLFSIDPKEFVGKVQDSFQFARSHELTLQRPDLWGPILAVFILPHSLLLSLEVSKHGCNQASMLGSGVLVSLGMWISLSLLYMTVSFLFVVKLKATHCFSLVGYSFFSWNVALLTSWFMVHVIGADQDGWLLKLPLLLGLPTSVLQGYLFYKKTFPVVAAQNSAITNRTIEFRGVVFTVRQVIKALVFLIVAGFHFNAFVYLAHVYLQEKRQTCHISFLIEFSKGFKFSPSFFLGN